MPTNPVSIGFNVPFNEAIAQAVKRGVVLPDVYYGQLQGLARQQAFSIAGITSLDTLQAVKDSLDKVIAEGGTFGAWQKHMLESGTLNLPRHRLDNIYRTNLQGSYMAARWDRILLTQATRPYIMYDALNDSRVRPAHLALDGIIRRVDDPFWTTHSPPNGYRCRCSIRSLSEHQARARSGPGKGLNNPALLEDGTPALPDKGWDYNPSDRLAGVNKALVDKRGKVNDVLLSAFEKKLSNRIEMTNYLAPYRQEWEQNFPKVILNAPLGNASKHPSYEAAKSGDLEAAAILVTDLISNDAISQLKNVIGNKKPLLIPVHAEEDVSINRIPLAYAMIVGRKLDLPVELDIVQSAKVNRTNSDGFGRLAFPPPFAGKPITKSEYAIIFDDTLTQGGTLANLRGHIYQFGMKTIAATTLTGKNYSSVLAITTLTLDTLRKNYNELEYWWISFFGYGFDCLTESEARYIINSKKTAVEIRDRIIAERQTGIL